MKSMQINAIAICGILTAGVLAAQQPAAKPAPQSPPVQATIAIEGKSITIDYSSPRVRGREGKIFGKNGLIATGDASTYPVWRAGANAATTLKTDVELKAGDTTIPAGKYTLWVDIGDADHWVLIINKQTGQWGRTYTKAQDVARIPMKMEKGKKVTENLTYALEKEHGGLELSLQWEYYEGSVKLGVK